MYIYNIVVYLSLGDICKSHLSCSCHFGIIIFLVHTSAALGTAFLCGAPSAKRTLCCHFVFQGVVTAICPIHPPATAIKVKSRDQAYKIGAIKGSRWLLGPKLDQIKTDSSVLSIWKYHN